MGGYSQILPQLDQQAIFNSFNFSLAPELETKPPIGRGQLDRCGTFINSLICPTDAASPG